MLSIVSGCLSPRMSRRSPSTFTKIIPRWNSFFNEAAKKTGRSMTPELNGINLGWFEEAGFPTDRTFHKGYKAPVGMWPADKKLKEVGCFNLASRDQGLEGYRLYFGTQVLSYSVEEMHLFFAEMRKVLLFTHGMLTYLEESPSKIQ